MKRFKDPKGTFFFIILASAIMVIVQFVVLDGGLMGRFINPHAEKPEGIKTPEQLAEQLETDFFQYEEIFEPALPFPEKQVAEESAENLVAAMENLDDLLEWLAHEKPISKNEKKPEPPKTVIKKREYVPPRIVEGHPEIAIIIDDVGMDRKHSLQVAEMDAPLTLAFLPYAPDLERLAGIAKQHGHELMIHMPMQAMDSRLSLGSISLREDMDKAQVESELDQAFKAFDGYVGLNNHMGSRLTQNAEVMALVMQRLKEKGLYFVDSKTIGHSVAADVARSYGLRTGERDIFLDHVNSAEFVASALRELEAVAERRGYAIAIGHPKSVTIEGLRAWIPDAQARGFKIVYASALVSKPKGESVRAEPKEAYGPPSASITINSDPLNSAPLQLRPLTQPPE